MAASKQTEARWRALVRDQESSGRSVKEFAEARGLSAATLYWWRSALSRRAGSSRPRLAEVRVLGSDTGRDSQPFELALPRGRYLRVPRDFDGESLSRLLRVLEERC